MKTTLVLFLILERGGELIDSKVPQASTIVAGKTRYATRVEANAGTETEAALTPDAIRDLIDQIQENQNHFVPTGMIAWYTVQDASQVPGGWVVCDGRRIYDEGVFSDLYQLLRSTGNVWGNGSSSDVVRLPDLRGRFIRGYHYDTDVDPDSAAYGAAVEDSLKSHAHGVTDPGHTHTETQANDRRVSSGGAFGAEVENLQTVNTGSSTTGISIQSAGGSETKPKNISLTPFIKL